MSSVLAASTYTYGLSAPCHLLCGELVRAHGDAVNKLHGAPQTMELHALVHVHHTVGGRRPAPHPVIQETADARQDNFKHGKATAKALFGQQVTLTCNCNLLERSHILLLLTTFKIERTFPNTERC